MHQLIRFVARCVSPLVSSVLLYLVPLCFSLFSMCMQCVLLLCVLSVLPAPLCHSLPFFLSFSLSVEMCFFVFLSIYMCHCFFLYCCVFPHGSFHVWPRVSLGFFLVMLLWISLSLFLFRSLSLCLSLSVPLFLFLSWALSVGLDLSRLQHVQNHLCCTHNEFRHSLDHLRLFDSLSQRDAAHDVLMLVFFHRNEFDCFF